MDKALLRQQLQRLADGRTTDAELFGKTGFGKGLAGLNLAKTNSGLDLIIGPISQKYSGIGGVKIDGGDERWRA